MFLSQNQIAWTLSPTSLLTVFPYNVATITSSKVEYPENKISLFSESMYLTSDKLYISGHESKLYSLEYPSLAISSLRELYA